MLGQKVGPALAHASGQHSCLQDSSRVGCLALPTRLAAGKTQCGVSSAQWRATVVVAGASDTLAAICRTRAGLQIMRTSFCVCKRKAHDAAHQLASVGGAHLHKQYTARKRAPKQGSKRSSISLAFARTPSPCGFARAPPLARSPSPARLRLAAAPARVRCWAHSHCNAGSYCYGWRKAGS